MSLKFRVLWVIPTVLLGSWLTVRSFGASREVVLDDPPLTSASGVGELRDPALSSTIGQFASAARGGRR